MSVNGTQNVLFQALPGHLQRALGVTGYWLGYASVTMDGSGGSLILSTFESSLDVKWRYRAFLVTMAEVVYDNMPSTSVRGAIQVSEKVFGPGTILTNNYHTKRVAVTAGDYVGSRSSPDSVPESGGSESIPTWLKTVGWMVPLVTQAQLVFGVRFLQANTNNPSSGTVSLNTRGYYIEGQEALERYLPRLGRREEVAELAGL